MSVLRKLFMGTDSSVIVRLPCFPGWLYPSHAVPFHKLYGMRSIFLFLLLILLSVTTLFSQVKKRAGLSPGDQSRGDKESILAILYQQRAAEYTALCLQSYNLARRKIEAAIANPVLTKDNLPLAVITDLDETALDNSANEVHQFLRDSLYDPKEFNRWIKSEQADTVPGSIEFFNYVDSLSTHGPKKIDIYYISNRDDSMVSATLDNMKKLGFPQCDPAHCKFKTTTSSKEARRQEVLQDHQIIVLLGDNLIDLDAHFDGYHQMPDQRMGQVYNMKGKWGDLYIVLPNADYGDWESYLYLQYRREHNGVPPSDLKYIEQQRKDQLKSPAKDF
jgi:5'-nucleotidase (lipoprotein e(P4) family)